MKKLSNTEAELKKAFPIKEHVDLASGRIIPAG